MLIESIARNAIENGTEINEGGLRGLNCIPRERFVPRGERLYAYEDRAIYIGLGQTVSQPTMVAWMTSLLELKGDERVLEVGTGSGYQALAISILLTSGKLITIERHPWHGRRARRRLHAFGANNVQVVIGDGSAGYSDGAPYDRILVTAGAPEIPRALVSQLASPGRLVCPVGPRDSQELTTVDIDEQGNETVKTHGRCVFVPLVGEAGWNEPE